MYLLVLQNANTSHTIINTNNIEALVVDETFPTIEPESPTVTEPILVLSRTFIIGDVTEILGRLLF